MEKGTQGKGKKDGPLYVLSSDYHRILRSLSGNITFCVNFWSEQTFVLGLELAMDPHSILDLFHYT